MRPTLLLLLVLLAGAAPARAAGPEIGVADDRILMAGGAQADRVVAEWQANGVDVVRVFAQSTRIERWGWSELDASVARVRGAGWSRSSPSSGRACAAGQGAVRGVRGAGRGALRRRGRPLHRLERAQPPGLAAAAGGVLARALLAGGAAPLPRARARRPPGDPCGRPGRPGPDRGDVLARAGPAHEGRDRAPDGVPARARLRRRALAPAAHRLLQGLQARDRRRLRVPPARHARPLPTARTRTPTTSTSPRSAGSRARSTGCSAAGGCWRRRRGSASTSTSTATRRGRPTGPPASRSRRRTAGSSGPPTAPGAIRA